MTEIYRIFGIVMVIGITTATLGLPKGRSCKLKDDSPGTCLVQTDCNYARELAQRGQFGDLVICSFSGSVPVVCCPTVPAIPHRMTSTQNDKAKSEQYCDLLKALPSTTNLPSIEHHIRNGVPASVREFPHMVAIGFEDVEGAFNENKINYKCAGTLISRKWVLTASHCLRKGIAQVRVGGISLSKSANLKERPQVIKIKRNIKYPEYRSTSKYEDIALIELEKNVDVTDGFARPLCLPTMNSKSATDQYKIAGWGFVNKTALTDILFKADIYELPQSQCVNTFKSYAETSYELDKGIIGTQLCAENKKTQSDTCQGDSGGPMFFNDNGQFYIYGVTSFGLASQCSVHAPAPGIYTRVFPYLKWIEDNVWPENDVNDF